MGHIVLFCCFLKSPTPSKFFECSFLGSWDSDRRVSTKVALRLIESHNEQFAMIIIWWNKKKLTQEKKRKPIIEYRSWYICVLNSLCKSSLPLMMLSAFQSLLIILLPAPVLMSSLSIQTSCMTCLYLPPAFSHLPFTSELQSGFRLYYLLKTKLARVLHNLLVTKHVDPFQSISLVLLNMRQYEYSFE